MSHPTLTAIATPTTGVLPLPRSHGEFCDAFGRRCYRIAAVETLPPFLINLVSASPLWMFVASNGALTAGRGDADAALFPYQTVDRIYDSAGLIGPMTLLAVETEAGEKIWAPFAAHPEPLRGFTRNLYKSLEGDVLWFEEIRDDLGLVFRYGWSSAEDFGFIRRVELENRGSRAREVRVLDGLRNLLPAGVSQSLQGGTSNLADAYKTAERLPGTTLAVYALAAAITDRPTPIESLRASTAWSGGLPGAEILLSDAQVGHFRAGRAPVAEPQRRGVRCAYFQVARATLEAGQTERWFQVADTGLGQAEVEARRLMAAAPGAPAHLAAAERSATDRLRTLVGGADGFQAGGDETATAHHFSNVLFNVLRGGTFLDGHRIPADDFAAFLAVRNRAVAARHQAFLRSLPESLPRSDLIERVRANGDVDLIRLAGEYLPLMFSRRHGDPSRPWNRFCIRLRDEEGRRLLAYEGNWRDIFQNWEALGLSYPEFFEAFVAKFVNCSTADGYNPYRISQVGLDWEVPDGEDPWAAIGYWGDHQVIYLLKLLEWSVRYQPEQLAGALRAVRFTYADVPYRISEYPRMRQNPRATITFDRARHRAILNRQAVAGTDARLLTTPGGGGVLHVNLAEKLLVLVLVRLTNFIPGGGIWMNTQRPEWNDANNALVGYGVSLVTLAYLRRFLQFVRGHLLPALGREPVPVSGAVATLLETVHRTLATWPAGTQPETDPVARRRLVDQLAGAGSSYRARIYAEGPGTPEPVSPLVVEDLVSRAITLADHTLRANLRPDGLAHAYHQLEFTEEPTTLTLRPLTLMLEGQVAMLSAGLLGTAEVVALLEALRASPLFRPDQHSYLLYPDRALPGFLERNLIPEAAARHCPWLEAMVVMGDRRLVQRDALGRLRFHADLASSEALEERLANLASDPRWAPLAATQAAAVREVYEQVFRHRAFTGRSSSMFGFEGLGCIYWHMVAKLLLAVQEQVLAAQAAAAPQAARLIELYYEIRAGLGFNKPPAEYGAFPTDPYSHTPSHAGAQQPGMTGQVKEEIITRYGELGVLVEGGRLRFRPTFLRAAEFTAGPAEFRCVGCDGRGIRLDLPAGSLGFTVCGIPVIYRRLTEAARLLVVFADGSGRTLAGEELDAECSAAVLARDGRIARLEVELGTGFYPWP